MANKKKRKVTIAPATQPKKTAPASVPVEDGKDSRTLTAVLFLLLAVIISIILAALENVKQGMLEG